MKPFSNVFTLRTIDACSWADMLLWITPIPPMSAIVMAMSTSVTVSMGLERNGELSTTLRVMRERRSTLDAGKLM